MHCCGASLDMVSAPKAVLSSVFRFVYSTAKVPNYYKWERKPDGVNYGWFNKHTSKFIKPQEGLLRLQSILISCSGSLCSRQVIAFCLQEDLQQVIRNFESLEGKLTIGQSFKHSNFQCTTIACIPLLLICVNFYQDALV